MEQNLNEFLQYLKDAVEFGKEQAPDVVRQLITYERAFAWFFGVISLALLISAIVVAYRLARKCKADEYYSRDHEGAFCVSLIYSIVGGLFGSVFSCINASMLIKLYAAPKVYILEYIRHML